MMRGRALTIVAVLFLAAMAAAEISELNRGFLDGPAGYIATKAEMKAFAKVTGDAEVERFIELFWAKRDPDLTTAVNEFKVDFELRVTAADKQFGNERVKGSMSDRGRTLIIMGRPFGISHQSPDAPVNLIGDRASDRRGAIEVWTYRGEQVPESVKALEVYFIFVETRIGVNDFPLDRAERRNGQAMKLLADAPERLLRHPGLKEVPRVGLLAGSKAATAGELAVLAAEPRPWPEGAEVRVAQGVQSGSLFPLWLHVRLPAAAPAVDGIVGRATSEAAGEAGSFAAAARPVAVPGGSAYELSLPLGPGAWKVELALLAGAAPVAVTTVSSTREAVPADGAWISPIIWGAEVRQESLASLGDPFNIGGWHVIPKPGNSYRLQDTLSYFCTVVRPGLSADRQPAVETSIAVYFDSKKLTETEPEPAPLSPVAGELWMFGSSLPLGGFPTPGEYRVEITVRDTISGATRTTGIPLVVAAP